MRGCTRTKVCKCYTPGRRAKDLAPAHASRPARLYGGRTGAAKWASRRLRNPPRSVVMGDGVLTLAQVLLRGGRYGVPEACQLRCTSAPSQAKLGGTGRRTRCTSADRVVSTRSAWDGSVIALVRLRPGRRGPFAVLAQ